MLNLGLGRPSAWVSFPGTDFVENAGQPFLVPEENRGQSRRLPDSADDEMAQEQPTDGDGPMRPRREGQPLGIPMKLGQRPFVANIDAKRRRSERGQAGKRGNIGQKTVQSP